MLLFNDFCFVSFLFVFPQMNSSFSHAWCSFAGCERNALSGNLLSWGTEISLPVEPYRPELEESFIVAVCSIYFLTSGSLSSLFFYFFGKNGRCDLFPNF